MAHLINDSSGEIINIPRGDSSIGRGPLLKVYIMRGEKCVHAWCVGVCMHGACGCVHGVCHCGHNVM